MIKCGIRGHLEPTKIKTYEGKLLEGWRAYGWSGMELGAFEQLTDALTFMALRHTDRRGPKPFNEPAGRRACRV